MKNKSNIEIKCKKLFGMNVKSFLKSCKRTGMTLPEAAKELGCSYSYIHVLAEKHEVKFAHGQTVMSRR